MEVNGIAHIQLSVNDFAVCREFYAQLFDFMGMQVVFDSDEVFYGVGSRTGIALRPSDPALRNQPFDQGRAGLHHFCFRARSKDDVDALYVFLKGIHAHIVHPPEEGPWAPGYYSVLFEDPDGIRLEANFIPGKGNLSETVELPVDIDKVLRKEE